ncbi:MAG TPA: 16S rRNA (cytosine(967)-C(5))-methyltransferase RsmB [candidate division Zixibacteria bacterium]|nr:16S rRNA (cytosine(967)-C(5))-methyltransferase RsmB [candidate division Zixibacteria bacterium]
MQTKNLPAKTKSSSKKYSPREIALRILYGIEEEGLQAADGIDFYCGENKSSNLDRRFITELVNGTTKLRRRIDFGIQTFLKEKLEKLTPWIRNILRMGVYQLDYMDKVPESAAVDESVKLAKKYGHSGTAGLVNAVLRSYIREKDKILIPRENPVEFLGIFYSFPDWMIEKWLSEYGEENTIKLCGYFNAKPKISFRVNLLKTDSAAVEKKLTAEKIEYQKSRWLENFYTFSSAVDLDNLDILNQGAIYIQDESTALPVLLLNPQPGETVLDLCAAPGGKTIFMAEKMQNKGKIIALDKSLNKLKLISENCQRLGVKIVETKMGDGTEFETEPVDKILLDAPCSGLGVLERNAEARWLKQEKDMDRLSQLQLTLLNNAKDLLKKGGIMVYSTCSLAKEENEMVVEKFLQENKNFSLGDAAETVNPESTENKFVKTYPFSHNTDGSFAAGLKKDG